MLRMKSALLAVLVSLMLAACSDSLRSPDRSRGAVAPGTIEQVDPVELRSLSVPDEDELSSADDPERRYGDRLVVRLDDGRHVYLIYTGPRQFLPGQSVYVRVGKSGAFIL
jgi:hypothetical protein